MAGQGSVRDDVTASREVAVRMAEAARTWLDYLRVFGEPADGGSWGWRFGGHHVSLNNLVVDGVLLPRAPSDFVTANRTLVSDGDRVIPLAGVWRDQRFLDPVEQAKLQKLSEAIDEASGLSDTDHQAVSYSTTPKGVPGPAAASPHRMGQHAAQGQPCALGVARSHLRLRSRRPRPPSSLAP